MTILPEDQRSIQLQYEGNDLMKDVAEDQSVPINGCTFVNELDKQFGNNYLTFWISHDADMLSYEDSATNNQERIHNAIHYEDDLCHSAMKNQDGSSLLKVQRLDGYTATDSDEGMSSSFVDTTDSDNDTCVINENQNKMSTQSNHPICDEAKRGIQVNTMPEADRRKHSADIRVLPWSTTSDPQAMAGCHNSDL